MVHLSIDCDVVSEVILVHQATAHVHFDLLQVRVIDDTVSVHVAGPQGHGGRCIDGTGGTVYTIDFNGNIGTVAVNVSKFHRDSRATDRRAVDAAAARRRGARDTGNRLREGKHNALSECATISHPAFNARGAVKRQIYIERSSP